MPKYVAFSTCPADGLSRRPIQWDEDRSWSDYMVAITLAIGHDLRTQTEAFDLLGKATSSPGDLTDVRLLDIVAWTSKGAMASRPTETPNRCD